MQKQSDLLLNADDLDAMWVCLRENCVIDDATGAEKVRMPCFHDLLFSTLSTMQELRFLWIYVISSCSFLLSFLDSSTGYLDLQLFNQISIFFYGKPSLQY